MRKTTKNPGEKIVKDIKRTQTLFQRREDQDRAGWATRRRQHCLVRRKRFPSDRLLISDFADLVSSTQKPKAASPKGLADFLIALVAGFCTAHLLIGFHLKWPFSFANLAVGLLGATGVIFLRVRN